MWRISSVLVNVNGAQFTAMDFNSCFNDFGCRHLSTTEKFVRISTRTINSANTSNLLQYLPYQIGWCDSDHTCWRSYCSGIFCFIFNDIPYLGTIPLFCLIQFSTLPDVCGCSFLKIAIPNQGKLLRVLRYMGSMLETTQTRKTIHTLIFNSLIHTQNYLVTFAFILQRVTRLFFYSLFAYIIILKPIQQLDMMEILSYPNDHKTLVGQNLNATTGYRFQTGLFKNTCFLQNGQLDVLTLIQIKQQIGLVMSFESLSIDVCCLFETRIQD